MVRLQQISTGGSAIPRRGGQPSIRNTESSTQAVIKAVYIQVLGNSGYEGERLNSQEARLENGDISLRDFIRSVARSDAFRRRYWEGLYIAKSIEVMHRRLLGRPTFGRWEIDALFDTAARRGFYGLVDALIDSKDYGDCFGEDTVPYERFITPKDLTTRRAPGLRRALDPSIGARVNVSMTPRPEAIRRETFRTTGDVTKRNIADQSRRSGSVGKWTSDISGFTPPEQLAAFMLRRVSSSAASLNQVPRLSKSNRGQAGIQAALPLGNASGYKRREGLPTQASLARVSSESELREILDATYRQLLNRVPLETERLITAESMLRNGQIDLDGFVESVALSETFQDRLSRMAPLRAATAASIALLGRASTPLETSRFLQVRAVSGQPTAVRNLLELRAEIGSEPSDVPGLSTLSSRGGVPQSTITRTASLYGGNAGLTPRPDEAL